MQAIKKTVQLNCSVEHAFHIFTEKMHIWWPGFYRMSGESEASMVLEPHVEGALYSMSSKGDRKDFGTVERWEPPSHITFSWSLGKSTSLDTKVDVQFQSEKDKTLVEIVHRAVLNRDDAWGRKSPGFDEAWSTILPAYDQYIKNEQ